MLRKAFYEHVLFMHHHFFISSKSRPLFCNGALWMCTQSCKTSLASRRKRRAPHATCPLLVKINVVKVTTSYLKVSYYFFFFFLPFVKHRLYQIMYKITGRLFLFRFHFLNNFSDLGCSFFLRAIMHSCPDRVHTFFDENPCVPE